MANANKTVKKFREQVGFGQRDRSNTSTGFAEFVFNQSEQGRTFTNIDEARKAFEKESKDGKRGDCQTVR